MPNHRRSAQAELAKRGVAEFGLPRNVEPIDALMEELWRTSGLVSFYESRIRELDEKALSQKVGGEGESDTGLTYHARSEANVFIRMHKEEREHLVKVAKTCIDAGIEERRVRIAEAQGAMIAGLIRAILVGVGVDVNSPKVRKVVRAELTSIQGSATDITSQSNQANGSTKTTGGAK
jgi:hypothetical protein